MKIIDNFLSPSDFEIVQQYFLSDDFVWYYHNCIACDRQGLDQFQFDHLFFSVSQPSKFNWSPFLQPIFTKLNARYILRVKANLRPRTSQGVLSDYHVDMELNQQTAIFYINTNNGYTRFEDDSIPDVKSVANRLVTFPGDFRHCGCSATDCNNRIVLNINYIPNEPLV